ncbi:wall associated kinase-like 1 [Hibiscus trionum]|uniref:Wall associated kinase-like 1 n=1 Tax=Hibiscus trionum TaxID=183268 RepID=A0A9W7H623_HIBTR|nr:wall associated kinase-like 1 [Hibiscus trionum]
MGFHLGFYTLLFFICPMLDAAKSQEISCGEEFCGNVTIPFPFGIHRSCYTRSWFRVSCKRTHDGEKPFVNINGIDVEVLGTLFSPGTILIKNPVTYVNCDHKMDATVRVNLTGTPFYFSTDYNMFGSVGCGSLATIFDNDGEPLGGCIQPICGDRASKAEAEPGCFNQVFGNFSSTMVNMTTMYPGAKDESKRCASGFLFSRLYFRGDDPLAIGNGINIETTHVPTTLSWNSTYCGDAGCGNLVTIFEKETSNLIGGCLQPSCKNHNESSSSTGCHINVPRGLNSFFVNMSGRVGSSRKKSCGFASLVTSDVYYHLAFEPHDFDINNWTHVQISLQWSTPIPGLCHLRQGLNTTCTSDHQSCWQSLGSTHLCVCNKDYGIGDFSRLCEGENCGVYVWCHMLCLNTPGNYCSSRNCPLGYEYNSTEFRCEPKRFISLVPPKNTRNWTIIIIGCSTSFGTIFLLLGTWGIYKALKRRRDIMMKQKHFKKNGGFLLQQHLSGNKNNLEKVKLFTSKEMEKATDYYNENRILGEGGQGTVYKGMLTDGSIVAIKKSKTVKGNKFDEKKVEQLVNEVIILSQTNHRNVVKLLGCCLEDQVPLLVYEFIPNGTLHDLIHYQTHEFPLTWEMRLRIAIEIANALFYLHSAAYVPIYHRDIKSSNILLDDKYRAKVSDFGTSRSIALEQTHLTTRVQGTFGYMDPEYFRSSQFTEKSDVYSFGVVLVELLTGQKPISKQTEEVRSLVSCFLLSMQENSLFELIDSIVLNDGPEKEIIAVAKLAKRCLHLDGKKRPTMKQVAMELESIKTSEEGNVIEQSGDDESEIGEITESWDDVPPCSSTRTRSLTLSLNASF